MIFYLSELKDIEIKLYNRISISHMVKTFLKILGILLLIIMVTLGYLVVNADSIADKKLRQALSKLPEHIKITYDGLDFDLLEGNLKFKNSQVNFNMEGTDSLQSTIKISDISILDIDYSEYLFNDKILIESLILNNPEIIHHIGKKEKDSISQKQSQTVDTTNSQIPLHIGSLIVKNGSVDVISRKLDTLVFTTRGTDINIHDVEINNRVTDLLPFTYSEYWGSTKNLFIKLGDYEFATIDAMDFKNYAVSLVNANIKTKYSRSELSKIITRERDWYDIHIDSVKLSEMHLTRYNDTIRQFDSKLVEIFKPNVTIYRNKLVRDEYVTKHYYGYGLRHLPFKMNIDSLNIKNGTVVYQEKVNARKQAGEIQFPEFNAHVSNLANTNENPTQIHFESNFMKATPIEVQWNFKVSDTTEAYTFEANVGSFPTNSINQFSENNTNVRMEGTLNRTYITIHGNRYQNRIMLKVNYDDFKISLLNEERGKKKTLLSALTNIFIKKDSDNAWKDFRTGEATFNRVYNKSFYGNLWKTIHKGLLDAMTAI